MKLNFLELKNYSILEQLQIEEALLRLDKRNWVIVNQGSTKRSIVMGISSKPEEHINLGKASQDQIPLIKRFSGGGTVIVDDDTLFITLIIQKEHSPCTPFPEKIMRWLEALFSPAFDIPQFALYQNDFVIGDQKCGGNAQYIRKDSWLHHVSFLWDYKQDSMDYLLMPPKMPNYRAKRTHDDFLCKLCDYAHSKPHLIEKLKRELAKRYTLQTQDLDTILPLLKQPHRRATTQLEFDLSQM